MKTVARKGPVKKENSIQDLQWTVRRSMSSTPGERDSRVSGGIAPKTLGSETGHRWRTAVAGDRRRHLNLSTLPPAGVRS